MNLKGQGKVECEIKETQFGAKTLDRKDELSLTISLSLLGGVMALWMK